MKMRFSSQESPQQWARMILQRSGNRARVVCHHLVGATLQTRFPDKRIPGRPLARPSDAAARNNGYEIGSCLIHVIPLVDDIRIKKWAREVVERHFPILVVLDTEIRAAQYFVQAAGFETRIMIRAIEDFLAQNLLEMAGCEKEKLREKLDAILAEYNKRVENFELDKSLRIERK
jgi:hypothetical protein